MSAQDQRPQFYEGQYLSADDLIAIVEYLRTADARHSLGAHTWGISMGLDLLERDAPGAPSRVEIILQPGFAGDGFGRAVVVTRPQRVSEQTFVDLYPYSDAADDTTNGGTGRLVPVYLAYDEVSARALAPGFDTCADGDHNARVQEGFLLVVGKPQSLLDERAQVTIGDRSVDALDALKTFGPSPSLWETSVPHQTFPSGAMRTPRWLIPVGYVRWISRKNAVGYFAKGALKASENAAGLTRSFRRYLGTVAERIEAVADALVLHRRGEDPQADHRFAKLMSDPARVAELLQDLVWVEGNLRVGGDAKINGGKLHLRDADGRDQGTALYLARQGDDGSTGNRELRAVLGPDAQSNNRFVVGKEAAAATDPIAPYLVVVSDGKVGVGRRDPETPLNVVGDRIRLQDKTQVPVKSIDLSVSGDGVHLESGTDKLHLRSSGTAPKNQVLVNAMPGDGNVGVGTDSPTKKLHVVGDALFMGGNVGVGLVPASEKLEVQGNVKLGRAADLFAPGAASALRVVVGQVAASDRVTIGQQFRAMRTLSSGNCTVTFEPGFITPPVVVATPVDSSTDDNVLMLHGIAAAKFDVHTRRISGNRVLPQDATFTFVAFGPA